MTTNIMVPSFIVLYASNIPEYDIELQSWVRIMIICIYIYIYLYMLWPLLKSVYKIHVLWAYQKC